MTDTYKKITEAIVVILIFYGILVFSVSILRSVITIMYEKKVKKHTSAISIIRLGIKVPFIILSIFYPFLYVFYVVYHLVYGKMVMPLFYGATFTISDQLILIHNMSFQMENIFSNTEMTLSKKSDV